MQPDLITGPFALSGKVLGSAKMRKDISINLSNFFTVRLCCSRTHLCRSSCVIRPMWKWSQFNIFRRDSLRLRNWSSTVLLILLSRHLKSHETTCEDFPRSCYEHSHLRSATKLSTPRLTCFFDTGVVSPNFIHTSPEFAFSPSQAFFFLKILCIEDVLFLTLSALLLKLARSHCWITGRMFNSPNIQGWPAWNCLWCPKTAIWLPERMIWRDNKMVLNVLSVIISNSRANMHFRSQFSSKLNKICKC